MSLNFRGSLIWMTWDKYFPQHTPLQNILIDMFMKSLCDSIDLCSLHSYIKNALCIDITASMLLRAVLKSLVMIFLTN